MASRKASGRNRSAFSRQAAAEKLCASNASTHAARLSGVCSSKNRPVFPSMTVSSAPPCRNARTGRPAAWASTAVIPKSSICG